MNSKETIDIRHKTQCEEILENIKQTLHECRDNKKRFYMEKTTCVHICDNVNKWSDDLRCSLGLKLDIKRPIVKGVYIVDYNVRNKIITIK